MLDEVRIIQGRHAHVNQFYHKGKFQPVAKLGVTEPVLIIALEEGNRVLLSKDVIAGAVYDHCGYMIAQESCTFEELEAFRDKLNEGLGGLNLGNFKRRVFVYNGADRLMPTLMTDAGQHLQIRFSFGAEALAEHIDKMAGFMADVIGPHAVSVGIVNTTFTPGA